MSDEFNDWLNDLENQEQPEAPACGLNGEDCEACGS